MPDRNGKNAKTPFIADDTPADADEAQRYDLQILTAIRQIIRAVDIHSRRLASEHQVTGPQLVCLLDIVERGPVTATQIAESVHVGASTVVGILDRLESKGLAERRRDSSDRRLVYVSATDAGRRLIADVPSPLQASLYDALHELPDRDRAKLAEALQRVVELMQVKGEPEDE